MSSLAPIAANPLQGYFGSPGAGAGAPAPAPAAPAVSALATGDQNLVATNPGGQGPVLPLAAQKVANVASKVVPAGTIAAEASAKAILGANNGEVARIIGDAGEPIFNLGWNFLGDTFNTVFSAVRLDLPGAFQNFVNIFKDGAVNTGAIVKKWFEPARLSAATAGAPKLGLGGAIATGFQGALSAIKSSAIWAVPAATINAFIDYKYKDQTNTKRLATNFAADLLGYTATGMAGAAVGAAIGSMTMPIVGTLAGIAVGMGLGMFHDKFTRPLISDAIYDHI